MNQILKKLIILCFSFCTSEILASASASESSTSIFKEGDRVKIMGGNLHRNEMAKINGNFESVFKKTYIDADLMKDPLIPVYAGEILSLAQIQRAIKSQDMSKFAEIINNHPYGKTKDILCVHIKNEPYLVHKSWLQKAEELKSDKEKE